MANLKRYFYLVCKRGWYGRMTPIKVFSSSMSAFAFADTDSKYVVFRQTNDGPLEPIVREAEENA